MATVMWMMWIIGALSMLRLQSVIATTVTSRLLGPDLEWELRKAKAVDQMCLFDLELLEWTLLPFLLLGFDSSSVSQPVGYCHVQWKNIGKQKKHHKTEC